MSENNKKIETGIPVIEEVEMENKNEKILINKNEKILINKNEKVNNVQVNVNIEEKYSENESIGNKAINKQTQKKCEKNDKFKFTPRFYNKNQMQTQTLVNTDGKVDIKVNTDTTGDDNINSNRIETTAQTSFPNFLPNQGSSRCNINNPFFKPKLQSSFNTKSRERFRRRENYRKKRENERKLLMKNKIGNGINMKKMPFIEKSNEKVITPLEIKMEKIDHLTITSSKSLTDVHTNTMVELGTKSGEEILTRSLIKNQSRHIFDVVTEDLFDIDNLTKRIIPLTDELKNDHLSTSINLNVTKMAENEPFLEIVRNEIKKYVAELKLSDKYLHKDYVNVNVKKDYIQEPTKHALFDNENLNMTAKELFPNINNQRELDEINEIILQNFSYKNKNKLINENIGDFKTGNTELKKVDSGINSFNWVMNTKNEENIVTPEVTDEAHSNDFNTMYDDESDRTQMAMLEKIKQSLKIFQESSEYYNNQMETARIMSVDKKTSSNSLKHLTSEENIKVTKSDKVFCTSSKKHARKKIFHSSLQLMYKILQDCSSDDSICESAFNFGNNHKHMIQMDVRLSKLENRVKNIHKMLSRLKKIKVKELDVRKRELRFLEAQHKNICENKQIPEKYSEKIFDFRKSKRMLDDCFIRRKEIDSNDFINANTKDASSVENVNQFGEAYYERRQRNMNLLYYKKSERSIILNHRPVMEFSPPFLNVPRRSSNHKRFSRFIITPSRTTTTIPNK